MLLIIDDMHVFGQNEPNNVINLDGVKPYVIFTDCPDMAEETCKYRQDYWVDEFSKFGAMKPEYWNGIRAEINLIN